MNFLALSGMNDATTVLFVFLIGVLIIFLGMAVIIVILQLMGKVFDKATTKPKKEVKTETAPTTEIINSGVDEKTKAAIIGAIYMYYLNEGSNCEFIVKKIKRI